MVNVILRLFQLRYIVKLVHSLNISWYSSRLTYLMVNEYQVEVFDTVLFFIIGTFLLFMVWNNPKLEGKPRRIFNVLKYAFHAAIIGYICYEGVHSLEYVKMVICLIIYFAIEIVIILLHHLSSNKRESPEAKLSG